MLLFVCCLRRRRTLCLSMQWLLRLLWPFVLFYWTYAFYWRISFFSPNSVSDNPLTDILCFILFHFPEYLEENRRINNRNVQCNCAHTCQCSSWMLSDDSENSDGTWRPNTIGVYFGEIISLKLPPDFIIQLAQFKSLSFDTFYMRDRCRKDESKKMTTMMIINAQQNNCWYISDRDLALNRERWFEKKTDFLLLYFIKIRYLFQLVSMFR